MQRTILTYKTPGELDRAAAAEIVRSITASIAARHVCHCALTGGTTPQGIYRMLAGEEFKRRIAWEKVHLYFGDERMVPPSDAESNFGMAQRTLISQIAIPLDHVHRIHGEMAPAEAASLYARELSTFLPGLTFDLMLLGLGEDGHVASIFPGTDIIDELQQPVCAVYAPSLKAWRVSLTLPVINRSREILFLVSGERKASVLKRLRSMETPSKDLPSSLVHSEMGGVLIMCDEDAASG